jgi:hypothetical protein
MFSRGHKKLKTRVWRSLVAVLLTANHLVVALGLPIPVPGPPAGRKSGELFPCMDCPCGCRTAEQCWRHCCCHTVSQRLAWAQEHGVTPPAYILEAARESGVLAADDGDYCHACCCHCKKAAATGPTAESSQSKPGGYVLAIKALECQGGALGILRTLPAVVPAPAVFGTGPLPPPVTLVFSPPLFKAISTDVPVPPPRG